MLRRVIYISRSLIGGNADATSAIVASAMRENARAGITGMLWATADSFAQVIEGGPDEIGWAMDRIRADSRHTDIEVIVDRAVLSRQFGTWSMRRAGDDTPSIYNSAFLAGLALVERTDASRRLREIVLATL
jgi:hypothetical protein